MPAFAFPNPGRDDFAVRFTMPRAGDVKLSVVDAAGRIVRIVRAARLEAGEHVLRWDGRNARGAPTPPGVYFLELRTEAGGTSTRVVRIR